MEKHDKTNRSWYDLKVHLVWITRYGKPELWGEEAIRVRELIRKTCKECEVHILSGKVKKDHVCLLLSYPPQLNVSKLVHKLKTVTSHKKVGDQSLGDKPLWAHGYLAVSAGDNVTDNAIVEYLKNQADEEKYKKSSLLHIRAYKLVP